MERQQTVIDTFDATVRRAVLAHQDAISDKAQPFQDLHNAMIAKQAELDKRYPGLIAAWVDGGEHTPIQALRDEVAALDAKQQDIDEALALIDSRMHEVAEVLAPLGNLGYALAAALNNRSRIAQLAAQGVDHIRPDVRESFLATVARLPQLAAEVVGLMHKHGVEAEGAEKLLVPVRAYAERLADLGVLLGITDAINPELTEDAA